MWKALAQRLIERIHPREGMLAAFGDGELGPFSERWVERHIRTCTACRQEVRYFEEELSRFQLLAQPRPDPKMIEQGLEDLQRAMRDLPRNAQPPRLADLEVVAKRRLFVELEVCLGERAAAMLLDKMGQEDRLETLLAAALPILTGLLGRKTADAIVMRTFNMAHFESGAA
jgi:anti-sigma factor RsiW